MKVINLISQYLGYVATAVLGLMMLLTVADVFGRYVFNKPITGATEMLEFMMVIVVFLALAWCTVARKNVRVNLIINLLPLRGRAILDSITLFLSLATFVVITWQSFLESTQVHLISSTLRISVQPFYWLLTVGIVVFCLATAALLIDKLSEAIKK